jgi:hypothetical protein
MAHALLAETGVWVLSPDVGFHVREGHSPCKSSTAMVPAGKGGFLHDPGRTAGRGKVSTQPILGPLPRTHTGLSLDRRKKWGRGQECVLPSHRCVQWSKVTAGGLAAPCVTIGQVGPWYSNSHCCLAGGLSCRGSAVKVTAGFIRKGSASSMD